MNSNSQTILSKYIKENHGIPSSLGTIEITNITPLGEGGNGVVYEGTMNNAELAIKFLLNSSTQKLNRFKSEYLNTSYYSHILKNIVTYVHYDTLCIEDYTFPYIIMRKYSSNLKRHRKSLDTITWDEVKKLFHDLSICLKTMEKCNIIHRDLKPENILLNSNGQYIVADFGIAHFSDKNAPLIGLTTKGERLGNYNFSAPEQSNGGKISWATDLYAFAQIMYWFVFGETNRGVGGQKFSDIFNTVESHYLDSIIYWCLNNDPQKRPQSVDDIIQQLQIMRDKDKEIDPFEDMYLLADVITSVIPEMYNNVFFTENPEYIHELVKKINSAKPNRLFWFNTGLANNQITNFSNYEENIYLLNCKLIKITGVWGCLSSDIYNDLLIFEFENLPPFILDGQEYYHIAIINSDTMLPLSAISSGHVRYKGKVYKTDELNIKEIYVNPDDKDRYFAIGTFFQCSTYFKNDQFLRNLQHNIPLSKELLLEYRKNISTNIRDEVYTYL